MNISDFKAALQQIDLTKAQRLQSYYFDGSVNVSTLRESTDYDIRNHIQQEADYSIEYSFYDNCDDFIATPSCNNNVKRLMPKMLNWKKATADYYIWLDGSLRLTSTRSIDWMVNHCSGTEDKLVFFKHPERANIIEEIDYIESEIKAGNEKMIAQYNIDALKDQAKRYIEEFPFLETYPLLDTRAFIYKKMLIEGPRAWSNFMLNWYTHTITESMNDKISLLYVLAYSRMIHGVFEADLLENNYIKFRK
jgi:hypothetical protein